jgi:hypothetical protein
MADAAGVERGVRMRAINAATTVTTPGSLAWSPPA